MQSASVFGIAIGIPYSGRNHGFFQDGKKPTFVANGTKTDSPNSAQKKAREWAQKRGVPVGRKTDLAEAQKRGVQVGQKNDLSAEFTGTSAIPPRSSPTAG